MGATKGHGFLYDYDILLNGYFCVFIGTPFERCKGLG